MKFDRAKITFGGHVQEQVRTESGASVVLLGITRVGTREVLIGTVIPAGPAGEHPWINVWELDGSCGLNAYLNLVMTGQKRKLKGWINIYPDGYFASKLYPSPEAARQGGSRDVIACIHHEIEYEEGEGL